MKALPFKIPHGGKSSIHIDHEKLEQFYPHYHTHAENQLTLIIKGKGIAYIGDQIIEFKPDDIFLFGKKLPHVFKAEQSQNTEVESISVFFLNEFLGAEFLQIPESGLLSELFKDAKRGIRINDNSSTQLGAMLRKITGFHGLERILAILNILQAITQLEIEFITGPDYRRPRRQADGEKINDVFNFLTSNYDKDISLADVAETAHMSPTAFCRYFKQHTRKSYSRFLNEIRVAQACKLLQTKADAISDIAYRTGFNNISNFNRQFKKITGSTPSEYQKMTI